MAIIVMMITGLSKMDYQSPYFQLRLSLDHLMPGNHWIPLDHLSPYFNLKIARKYPELAQLSTPQPLQPDPPRQKVAPSPPDPPQPEDPQYHCHKRFSNRPQYSLSGHHMKESITASFLQLKEDFNTQTKMLYRIGLDRSGWVNDYLRPSQFLDHLTVIMIRIL